MELWLLAFCGMFDIVFSIYKSVYQASSYAVLLSYQDSLAFGI
jgi:hypothetical protein